MPHLLKTTYHPMLEPGRPGSYPRPLTPGDPAFVPLRPRPRAATLGRLGLLATRWRLWGSFAVSDRTLEAYRRHDPLGLATLARLGLAGATTMDVPCYRFFTTGQRERALLRALWIQAESIDAFGRLGLGCLPLVKGLVRHEIETQLDAAAEAGLGQAAFYARELLLEREAMPVARFLTACHARRIQPVLLGSSRPRVAGRGPAAAVGLLHVVAARRRERLATGGPRRRLRRPFLSTRLGAWVDPADAAHLAAHNLLTLRARFAPLGRLPAAAAA